jgi:hypothetical protein
MIATGRLQEIKENIEIMNKSYQIEILKILNNEPTVVISENNNGIFINLTDLDITIIDKLEKFIKYVTEQQNELTIIEQEKAIIKNEFFKQNKKIVKNKSNKEDNNIILDA